MTNNVYDDWLKISQVASDGVDGVFLCRADGTPLSRVGVWQRAIRSLRQAAGALPSRHPAGWPELHMDDGSVGVVKVKDNIILIHPEAVRDSELWRRKSPQSFTKRGPVSGKPKAEKPYVPKSKEVRDWLKEGK